MDRYWLETGTKLHKTYESARNYGSDYSAPDGRHEVVFYADAQATIAALQAWVQELEEWKRIVTGAGTDQESVIRLAATEYTKTAVQCWKEANARLASQLTQRTAELEAVKDKVQFLEKKNRNLLDSSNMVLKVKADQDVRLDDLQAELERVRGELADERTAYKALSEQYNRLDLEHSDRRTLIAALPKVEGEIEVCSGVYNFILLKHDSGNRFLCGQIETEQTAKAIAALWQHRQGMEG